MLNLIAGLDEFKGSWKALGRMAPEKLAALREVATIESIGASVRIEGNTITNADVEKMLQDQKGVYLTRHEQEVAGYAALVDHVFLNWQQLPFSEAHIRELHRQMLKYSLKDENHRGDYKTLTNHVEAFDQDGRSQGIAFRTASPFETAGRMVELMKWATVALEERRHHPLLVIAVFTILFLEIHPFQHGNGRLSRLLTTLLLLKTGYGYVPFSSLEHVIEQNRDAYHQSLRRTQATIRAINPDWSPWIMYFLKALQQQKDRLAAKLEQVQVVQERLPGLSVLILEMVKGHGRINLQDAVTTTAANKNTVKKHIQQLVGNGYLVKQGIGKSTWYTLL
ncbi:MAG: Fic family protein [Candidatus Pseudobacter hemicellulosilyticus]|uniref:Fic family protein n=1 Tax=Candidatus Pseudobacter hemicellulosilyticus TaxID=3121375 RepID=A0AAJ5WTQ7_9BACT|nr:MAG: Fic family protein [Pseudobacter sp.]